MSAGAREPRPEHERSEQEPSERSALGRGLFGWPLRIEVSPRPWVFSAHVSRRSTTRARRALAWLFALLLTSASALARGEARVLIFPPERTDPLIDEALIRISGELAAVGLRVEIRPPGSVSDEELVPLDAGDYGAIVLSQQRSRIDIRAYARGLETPVSQSAQRNHPGMDAEVVAVRAVEALRAAMIQYARHEVETQNEAGSGLPGAVTDFTRIAPLPEPREPTVAPPPSEPQRDEPSGPPVTPPPWSAWIGALAELELPPGTGQGGIQAAVWWQPSWFRLGLTVQHGFLGGRYDAEEGIAELQRTSMHVAVGAETQPWPGGFLFVAGGLGAAHYAARAEARTGFTAGSGVHWSPAFGLQAGGGHWLTSRLGVYLLSGGSLLTDAPRMRFDRRDVATVGRPTLNVSVGLMLGF